MAFLKKVSLTLLIGGISALAAGLAFAQTSLPAPPRLPTIPATPAPAPAASTPTGGQPPSSGPLSPPPPPASSASPSPTPAGRGGSTGDARSGGEGAPGQFGGSPAVGQFQPSSKTPSASVYGNQQSGPLSLQNAIDVITEIRNFFIVIGVIVVVTFVIWGGIDYVMARGNDEKIHSARAKITVAIIGALVLLAVFILLQTLKAVLEQRTFFTAGQTNLEGVNAPQLSL